MTNFDKLANIILNEAPISSYLKTVVNPASYVRGAGNVLKGAGKGAGVFTTSSDYLSRGLTKTGGAAAGFRGPSLGDEKGQAQKDVKTVKGQQQTRQEQPIEYSKTKTYFIVNNRQLSVKYAGTSTHGYPIYRVQGIPWAKSIVLEPKGRDRANAYFYPDKKPNFKKPPAVQKPSTLNFSPVENKLTVRTK